MGRSQDINLISLSGKGATVHGKAPGTCPVVISHKPATPGKQLQDRHTVQESALASV